MIDTPWALLRDTPSALQRKCDELRAQVALLREERGILQQQLRAAEALGLALVKQMKEGK